MRLFLVALKSVTKGRRAWMQALFLTLPELLLHHMYHALLLVFSGNGHIGINLCRSAVLDREWHLMEALEHGIPFKVIIQEQTSQVGMPGKSNTKKLICFALQPVCSRPDRNKAIYLWFFALQA